MTSKIKVDNINKVSDDSNIIKKCGTTTTIGSGASNPIVVDGSAVTLGRCGGTVALASGATQTGFGRTGTVDWQTTPKTGDFTGANGEGYFINTTSGTITMTLPSASAGDIISIQDYNNTFDSNSFSIQAPSGVKINGGTAAGKITLTTEGQGLTLVYVDATVGWRSIESTTFNTSSSIATFITATGGTITTVDTNYKVHTFTGPGTFTVCSVGNACGSNEISYMVVGGGGSGVGGGGGAGGFREGKTPQCTYTASPLACTSGSNNGLPVTATGYPVTVGGGASPPGTGSNTTFAGTTSIVSNGGGSGGVFGGTQTGGPGGSGGGSDGGPNPGSGAAAAGTGNSPPVSPSQGFPGGTGYHLCGSHYSGGGGGGATEVGASKPSGPAPQTPFGNGGDGATTSINGSPTAFAGGGGAANNYSTGGTGGTGGGGPGPGNTAGGTNTGGGGGGIGNGGSGVVIIRYKFQ